MSESATALDFREMLRKERQLARKNGRERNDGQGSNSVRAQENYLAKRKSRLELRRDYRVEGPVQGIYYVPDFVTREEGSRLEEAVRRGTEGAGESGWRDLYKRRLQIHGGTPHPSGMLEEELPPFLQEVCSALVDAGIFPESSPPNHVLLNEYSGGQGIGPHKDGPLYEGRVAILSLGRTARLDFWGSLEDAEADWIAAAALSVRGRARSSPFAYVRSMLCLPSSVRHALARDRFSLGQPADLAVEYDESMISVRDTTRQRWLVTLNPRG